MLSLQSPRQPAANELATPNSLNPASSRSPSSHERRSVVSMDSGVAKKASLRAPPAKVSHALPRLAKAMAHPALSEDA
ncbi:hypothetical protein CSX11_27095 [Mycobacterium goodii]|nr:hypothetical protein CSX11_27095 [Mycolicibacterium goodii]